MDTVKVKLLTSRSGPAGVMKQGDEVELSAGEAKYLLNAGKAEAVGKTPAKKATKRQDKQTKAAETK